MNQMRAYDAAMNPLKKLVSWWRGSSDPEAAAYEAESKARRDTIRISQNMPGKGAGGSLLSAPTPDVLDPDEGSDRPR
jgi:hypothetical protein